MASQTFVVLFILFVLSSDMSAMVLGRMCSSDSEKFKGICILSANCDTVCKSEGFSFGSCSKLQYKCVCEKECGVLKPTSLGEGGGEMVMIDLTEQPMMQNPDLLPNPNVMVNPNFGEDALLPNPNVMVNPNFGEDVFIQNPTLPSTQNYNNPLPVRGFGDDFLPVRGSSGDDGIATDLRPIPTVAATSPSPSHSHRSHHHHHHHHHRHSPSPSPSPSPSSYSDASADEFMQTAADSDGELKEEFQLLP